MNCACRDYEKSYKRIVMRSCIIAQADVTHVVVGHSGLATNTDLPQRPQTIEELSLFSLSFKCYTHTHTRHIHGVHVYREEVEGGGDTESETENADSAGACPQYVKGEHMDQTNVTGKVGRFHNKKIKRNHSVAEFSDSLQIFAKVLLQAHLCKWPQARMHPSCHSVDGQTVLKSTRNHGTLKTSSTVTELDSRTTPRDTLPRSQVQKREKI